MAKNKKIEVNKGGRPPLYDDPEKMFNDGMQYFNNTDKPTITGLCLHLGFESRQSFYDTESREGFSYTIKRLRMMIENQYETKLIDKDYATPGVIFALKNLGWKDTQEVENNVNVTNFNISDLVKFK